MVFWMVVLRAAVCAVHAAALKPPPIQKLGAENHILQFISVINHLDAKHFCFTVSLFYASTCFEHHVLIIRRSKLCYTASGIITHIGVMIPKLYQPYEPAAFTPGNAP